MFLLGAAKNVGADPLSNSVETLLDHLKILSGSSFLADEAKPREIDSGNHRAELRTPECRCFVLFHNHHHIRTIQRHFNCTENCVQFSGIRRQPPDPNVVATLSRAQRRVRERFDASEMCARNTMQRWHREGRCAAAAAAAAAGARPGPGGRDSHRPPGHEPDLEMAFVQATLQIRASEELLRRVMRPPRARAAARAAA